MKPTDPIYCLKAYMLKVFVPAEVTNILYII